MYRSIYYLIYYLLTRALTFEMYFKCFFEIFQICLRLFEISSSHLDRCKDLLLLKVTLLRGSLKAWYLKLVSVSDNLFMWSFLKFRTKVFGG